MNTAEYKRKDILQRNYEIVVMESDKPTYELKVRK